MEHDGAKYEIILQQKEPEATLGASDDDVAHEPMFQGAENTAIALT